MLTLSTPLNIHPGRHKGSSKLRMLLSICTFYPFVSQIRQYITLFTLRTTAASPEAVYRMQRELVKSVCLWGCGAYVLGVLLCVFCECVKKMHVVSAGDTRFVHVVVVARVPVCDIRRFDSAALTLPSAYE